MISAGARWWCSCGKTGFARGSGQHRAAHRRRGESFRFMDRDDYLSSFPDRDANGVRFHPSLGPSNDAPEAVQVEIRAAELAINMDDAGTFDECNGWWSHPDEGEIDWQNNPSRRQEHDAGWLARELHTHDEREARDADAWPWDSSSPVAGQYEQYARARQARTLLAAAHDSDPAKNRIVESCAACDTSDGCEEHRLFTCAKCGRKNVAWDEVTEDGPQDVCAACRLIIEQTRHDVAASVARHAEIEEDSNG